MSVDNESLRSVIRLVLAIAPFLVFIAVYQRLSMDPFKGRWIPAIAVIFTGYTYSMLISQVWAIARLIMGRGAWAKTARVQSEQAV
jgi:hypothetical protein